MQSHIGQSEWRHYAETEYIRSMGQAAVMADGSILLLGGQVTFLNSTDFFFSNISCSVPYPTQRSITISILSHFLWFCISFHQERLGCGHNEPGCTGWSEEQTVERVSLEFERTCVTVC